MQRSIVKNLQRNYASVHKRYFAFRPPRDNTKTCEENKKSMQHVKQEMDKKGGAMFAIKSAFGRKC